MGRDTTFEAVIERLHEVATDPSGWPDVLELVSRAAGAEGAVLLSANENFADTPRSAGLEELGKRYFEDGWHLRDLRKRAVPDMLRGDIGVDQKIVTPEQMRWEPIYAELFAACGLQWWAGIGFPVGPQLWCVSIQRTPRQGMFEEEEQRRLQRLIAPLSRAGTLSHALQGAQVAGATDGLDQVRQPALVMDPLGRVLRINAACEALFDDWLFLRNRALVAEDRRAAREIAEMSDRMRNGFSGGGRLTYVLHRGERPPVLCKLVPLAGAMRSPFSQASVLVLLTDLEQRPPPPPQEVLRRAFGLTVAEARFAAKLAQLFDLSRAADDLGIRRETARSHLKNIFRKTNTSSQSQLSALLARL
jgi:DNA-binding CsgD family transcriptional regulator